AFRLLWSNFAKAFGSDNSRVPIIGETSLRSYTRYDKYTNILRAGNETFASVLGGVDVFTVHSHAVLEQAIDPMAERIARNIELVIKEEAFLGHIIDPAKGSYYLDTLTKEMASKAWALFQDIEAQGGYSNYQSSGALKEALQEYYQRQIDQLSQDHAKLVGTNNYVDASEILANSESPVATNRFAQAFEYLREKGQASDL